MKDGSKLDAGFPNRIETINGTDGNPAKSISHEDLADADKLL
jgi:hypothetical protein